jgi:hypothetical protein
MHPMPADNATPDKPYVMKEPLGLQLRVTELYGFCTGAIVDAAGQMVITGMYLNKQTAERLIACVNACAGLRELTNVNVIDDDTLVVRVRKGERLKYFRECLEAEGYSVTDPVTMPDEPEKP